MSVYGDMIQHYVLLQRMWKTYILWCCVLLYMYVLRYYCCYCYCYCYFGVLIVLHTSYIAVERGTTLMTFGVFDFRHDGVAF